MAQVIWSDPAVEQLHEIIEYIRRQAPANAERVRVRIVQAPRILEEFPEIGARVPEFEVDHIRELFVKPYRLLYVVRGDTCLVAAVIHASRDLPSLLTPEELENL